MVHFAIAQEKKGTKPKIYAFQNLWLKFLENQTSKWVGDDTAGHEDMWSKPAETEKFEAWVFTSWHF